MLLLSAAIDREFSGHMDEALQFVASGAESDGYGVHRDADMLEASMKGIGTKDERLSASAPFSLAGAHSDTFNSLSHHSRPLESPPIRGCQDGVQAETRQDPGREG